MLLGQIKIKFQLCLNEGYSKSYLRVLNCLSGLSNRGEDVLIWTSNLSTKHVSQSGGYVLIFTPGKMIEPTFRAVSSDCCINGPCYLKCRWKYYGSHMIPFFQNMIPYHMAGLHLVVSREEIQTPFARTWMEGK